MRRPSFPTAARRALLVLAALAGGARTIAAEPTATRVVFQCDWIENAQFAGLFLAVDGGAFAAAGLDVDVRPVVRDMATVAAVLALDAAGVPALGCGESNTLLAAAAAGEPIVIVATMFRDSPLGWMVLADSGIETLADLAGRHVGIHEDGDRVLALLGAAHGLGPTDFRASLVGYDPAILLRGEIDAMQAYAIDEYVRLRRMPGGGDARFLFARDHGYRAYSQVVFAPRALVESRPELVRAFLAALRTGWEQAFADVPAAVEAVRRRRPDLDREYQEDSLRAIRELMAPGALPPLAPVDPARLAASQAAYVDAGLLAAEADVATLVDNSFLPTP